MTGRTVVVVGGYWSTNIGNSFFQLGAQYLLEKACPDANVLLLGDQPGYWKAGSKGNPANALLLLEHIPMDYLVIQGPFLRPEFDRIWLPTLRRLHGRGVKLIALAAGMMDYSEQNIQRCRDWLAQVPPHVFTTRDTETFRHFHDLAEQSYDGIDVALFVPDFFPAPKPDLDPYIVFNFDKWPEPKISQDGQAAAADYSFGFDGKIWNIRFPRFRTALVEKSRALQFASSWFPDRHVTRCGRYLVVRTDHRFNPAVVRRMFRGPNSLVSDIPYSYLTLYAHATLTLSNRVHACVAALAYGNRAMLFSRTPRARLLDRVGAAEVGQTPVALDNTYLADEKARLLAFLRTALS